MTLMDRAAVASFEAAMAAQLGGARHVRSIVRRPSPNRSSFVVEDVDVSFNDGSAVELIAKAVHWNAMSPEARRAKPPFLWNPDRERASYEAILSQLDMGTARYYGSCVGPSGIPYLLLERVAGVPLWQHGTLEPWREAARWLARMHGRVGAETAIHSPAGTTLLRYDRDFYSRWGTRARAFQAANRSRLEALVRGHDRVADVLLDLPATFIHGEFYPANVLIETHADGGTPRVRPIDWEMAALGPALMDLACLIAGEWTGDERADIADAYYSAHATHAVVADERGARLRLLDACLVHLSVRNLGWSGDWLPPAERAYDWLAEGLRLCDKWDF